MFLRPSADNLARVVLSLLSFAWVHVQAQSAAHIDPMLGVDGGGNVIIGPSLPYGMAKPGPDMEPSNANAGWNANGEILGFSQTHVSGTGGSAKYGNILILPTTGAVAPIHAGSRRNAEQATAGYYSVELSRYKVRVEITAARRTSVYRFTYSKAERANLLFDVGHALVSLHDEGQVVTSSHAEVVSPTEVAGFSSAIRGWNAQSTPYTVYFYAISDTPAQESGTWKEAEVAPGSKAETYAMPEPVAASTSRGTAGVERSLPELSNSPATGCHGESWDLVRLFRAGQTECTGRGPWLRLRSHASRSGGRVGEGAVADSDRWSE